MGSVCSAGVSYERVSEIWTCPEFLSCFPAVPLPAGPVLTSVCAGVVVADGGGGGGNM